MLVAHTHERSRLADQEVPTKRMGSMGSRESPATSMQEDKAGREDLPTGWEKKLDLPSGKVFYVNHSLRAISWEPPPKRGPAPPISGAHGDGTNVADSPASNYRQRVGTSHSNSFATSRPRQPSSRSAHAQSPPDSATYRCVLHVVNCDQ
jgi:hypothetical protein